MKEGDVITKVGDQTVKDFAALANTLAQHKPGDKLSFEVTRGGEQKTLTITLGERRAPGAPEAGRGRRAAAFLGVRTQPLTADLKNRLGVTADQGVLVTDVLPNSPAAKAGLQQEDVITSFNGKPIADPDELRTAVEQAGLGNKATIGIVRGKEKKELTAQLKEAPGEVSLAFPRGGLPSLGTGQPGFPEGIFGDRQKIEQLERQVQQLQKRIKELEQKQAQPPK
jgi:S1-C subfamily serine protease